MVLGVVLGEWPGMNWSIERLVVEIIDSRRVLRCPHCGFTTTSVHDMRRLKVHDLPTRGRPTELVWVRCRFVCGECDERHWETHPEIVIGRRTHVARRLARTGQRADPEDRPQKGPADRARTQPAPVGSPAPSPPRPGEQGVERLARPSRVPSSGWPQPPRLRGNAPPREARAANPTALPR